jgi:hypothetical protein
MIVAFLMKNLYLRDNINDFCIESFESENRLIYFFKSYFYNLIGYKIYELREFIN